ncbi:hypothetical protein LK09_02625 [Microbacterium mangrovi]|uniref:Adenylate cyclase n=1 Tax=Microbacterium mangrovi TaxID=1348253 RepID=A0A0B2ACN8_9MICO|nr:hypothetical protein [Microbacterium mangrovi]KHK99538.1 hypothetical protein LK09_02625 [Microbacterium mangrovi]
MKRLAAGCALAVGLVLAGAGVANAGEYTGSGGYPQGTSHAASECAYSGLDRVDSLENNPPGFNDDAIAMRGSQKNGYHGVQSYGSFVRAGLKGAVPSPGVACNPTKAGAPAP